MVSKEYATFRLRIIDYLELITSLEELKSYQDSVPVNVPDELLCMWFDDLSMPESLMSAHSALSLNEIEAIQIFLFILKVLVN